MQRIRFWTPISLVFLSIVGFYGWTALSPHSGQKVDGVWSEPFYQRASTGYEQLAEAFLNGRLSMTEQPRPELLALPDPYDPAANGQFRHHDWVLYEGKYFLYWSPLPAILLFVPASLLGLPMNSALACIILSSTLLALLFALLTKMVPNYRSWSPIKSICLLFLLGFGSYSPILLRRPAAYEVAILMGSTFAALSLLLYLRFQTVGKRKNIWAFLSVLSSLLSFWSRPSYLFVPILIIGFLVFNNRTNLRRSIYFAGLPLAVIATAMGSYNYLRFESATEFGAKYQLAGVRATKFSVDWIVPKLHSDFFMHRFFGFFPWTTTGDSPYRGELYPAYNLEPNLGLLVVLPWAVIICIAAWQSRHSLIQSLNFRSQTLIIAFLSALGAWVIQLISVSGTTWRYVGDFAPFFLFVLLALLLTTSDSQISLALNFRIIAPIGLMLLLIMNHLGSIYSLAFILSFILFWSRPTTIKLPTSFVLALATLWTTGVIGLTSLTVGGVDPFHLLPKGFWWWEV